MYNQKLELFLDVAKEGSFSKVGALRYITPSAVIQKINHLERELSVSLFERTNQGVRLTEAGEYLAQEARKYIAEGQRIQNALKDIASRPNTIYVGSTPIRRVQLLYHLSVLYTREGHSCNIRLINLEDAALRPLTELIESVWDNSPWQAEWEFFKLCDVPLGCAISKHQLDGFGPVLPFSALKGWVVYSQLAPGTPARDAAYKAFSDQGIEIRKSDSYHMDLMWQGISAPIAMLAPLCWQSVMDVTKIIPLEGNLLMPYGLFYRKKLSPPTEEFLEFIKALYSGEIPGLAVPIPQFL